MQPWLTDIIHEAVSIALGAVMSVFIGLVRKLWRDLNAFFTKHRALELAVECLTARVAKLEGKPHD